MRADLSLQQAPPFSVPARFFVSAPLFGIAAGLILLWHGPQIISHRWTPELLAVTHFLTLGFLAMSMLGAMMQLIPVLMGMVIPRPVLFSTVIHTPLFMGSACLGLAWLLQINQLFVVAMVLLGFCFTVFIALAAERLLYSKNRHVTRSIMLLALLALSLTISLGIYLASGYAWQTISLARQLTDLHLSWGLLGWVLLLIMAVAYQVIPMFQITDEYPLIHQRWMHWSVLITLLGLSIGYAWPMLAPAETLKALSSILLAGCLLIFALTTLWVLHKRRRQLPDLTLNFWRLAMVSLVSLALLWMIAAFTNLDLPALLFAVLMIHGFAMTTINGMMYKIIPFIIWLHLSVHNTNLRHEGNRSSQVKVPHMRKIISETAGLRQFRYHLASLASLITATIWPQWFFYPAALLLVIAQAALLLNLLNAVRFYYVKISELGAVNRAG